MRGKIHGVKEKKIEKKWYISDIRDLNASRLCNRPRRQKPRMKDKVNMYLCGPAFSLLLVLVVPGLFRRTWATDAA